MDLKKNLKNVKFEKLNSTQITVCIICFILSLCFTIQVRTINTNESDALRLKKENELIFHYFLVFFLVVFFTFIF